VPADHPATGIADLRGAHCAVNGLESQSGYNALRALIAPYARDGRFFGKVTVTGAHAESIARVASGEIDVAAVDCVTHALLARHRPAALAGTRVLCRTASAPGLPYVTGGAADDDRVRRLREGLRAALEDPELADARETLMLAGIAELPLSAYGRIVEMENEAIAAGYARIA
jgi:ABC-type phosphate/phosphonate transport system substrate-binding protein